LQSRSDLGPDVGYEAIGICGSSLPTVGVWAKQLGKVFALKQKLKALYVQKPLILYYKT